ncbi:MAG: H(+)-transporting ATPase [Erysipelotrichaceae bacterium]|nr:H(+)-transporting ATPase [Erysipelotrichaceae bacterium]
MEWLAKAPTATILVCGFAFVILTGGFLLWLPISHNPGKTITFLDAVFEAGSAVCVTGLTVVPVGFTFNFFGRLVMAILIQIGGMGIVLLGIFLILLTGGKLNMKTRSLFVAAQNLFGYSQIADLARSIISLMFGIELVGALLSWPIFAADYGWWQGLGYACFHSVSAFNNAGFDILGGTDSLAAYASNIPMNLVTTGLVILGSFGFIAMIDLLHNRFKWRPLLLSTKISIMMTAILLVLGTVLLKFNSDMTWMQAWFQSVIARTAGFGTVSLASVRQAGLMVFVILMFIGANPNSTGGGVKTTTIFAAGLKAASNAFRHDEDSFFHRKIPSRVFTQANVVLFFMINIVCVSSFALLCLEPNIDLMACLVEVVSAAGTVGSTLGITSSLCPLSKIIIILTMFAGRVGPVTIANMLQTNDEKRAHFTEEEILIG